MSSRSDNEDHIFGDELPAWPDVPRLCFGPGSDWQLNACVDWALGMGTILPYAEGYRRAAEVVFESAVRDRESPDFALWPLAFLWRHHLELMLKDTIRLGRLLAEEESDPPTGHKLLKLWKDARPYIEQCGPPDSPALGNVESVIQEFERIDPGADGFRYPLSINGQRSLPNAPERVNLRGLQEAMLATSNFFDGVTEEMSQRLDYMNEARDYE